MSTAALAVRTGLPTGTVASLSWWPWLLLLSAVTLTVASGISLKGSTKDTSPQPAGITVREEAGQLMIACPPETVGQLEIHDGDSNVVVDLNPEMSRVTYLPRTGDVSLAITGSQGESSARFLALNEDRKAMLAEELASLTMQARSASESVDDSLTQIARLQKIANRMLARVTARRTAGHGPNQRSNQGQRPVENARPTRMSFWR